MRKTTFWVFWQTGSGHDAVRHARDYVVGPATKDEAALAAQSFCDELAEAGAAGVRLELHEPSPYHDRYDVTVLWPLDDDAAPALDPIACPGREAPVGRPAVTVEAVREALAAAGLLVEGVRVGDWADTVAVTTEAPAPGGEARWAGTVSDALASAGWSPRVEGFAVVVPKVWKPRPSRVD